jgi:serine/threonine protein kinase
MIKRWALDVALAVNYMHLSRPAVVHRDLKSANLLVRPLFVPRSVVSICNPLMLLPTQIAEDWSVKLTDFGLSRSVEGTAHMSVVGTTAWTAPEVLASQPYGTKADVFSFGILLWEFFTRAVPYAGTGSFIPVFVSRDVSVADMSCPDPVQVAVAVVNQQIRPTIPPSCPAPLAQLMQACWHQVRSRALN